MISVVIPLFNKESQIERTLRAVLKQSYSDFEIVIVNDGSTDLSVEKVKRFDDKRIRLINKENGGVSSARNKGIEEAKGDYIAFLDADDEWNEDYLDVQHLLAEKYPECDIFATDYIFKDAKGNVSDTIIRKLQLSGEDGIVDNYFEICSCSHPLITSMSVMIKREAIMSIGGFPKGIKSGEDLLTWARLVCKYKLAYSKKKCAIYNLGEGYEYTNLPPRKQDEGDPVGKTLKQLLAIYPHKVGLKSYISRWHKMRASVALRYNERIETIQETCKALFYDLGKTEVYPFLFLPLLPKFIIKRILVIKNSI